MGNLTTYLAGGSLLAVAVIYGLYAWTSNDLDAAEAELAAARTVQACVKTTAEDVNTSALDQVAALTAEVEKQKGIVSGLSRKNRAANARLAEIQRMIANVPQSENVPVSNHLEQLLDELRRAMAGTSGQPASEPDKADDRDAAGPARPDLPAEAGPTS